MIDASSISAFFAAPSSRWLMRLDVQQVIDQTRQVVDLAWIAPWPWTAPGSGVPIIQQFDRGQDRGQRVAQLVGERGEELILLAIGVAKRLLVFFAVGDVARDLGCADDPSLRVAQWRS